MKLNDLTRLRDWLKENGRGDFQFRDDQDRAFFWALTEIQGLIADWSRLSNMTRELEARTITVRQYLENDAYTSGCDFKALSDAADRAKTLTENIETKYASVLNALSNFEGFKSYKVKN